MAIINRVIPPFNGTMQTERPYVDDIFDPLFNKAVTDYYNGMYGNRLVGTLAGYADMWDNALTGREGILGPGMGVLSTFGRSMDKADDFILGGLTEGVNWLGQRFGGNNPDPVNPIKNIMVNDYDYQGARLMAAAGNAMSKLVGTQTPLTEANFDTLGDRIAGTSIDLLTDPGILGGRLATLKAGTPVGDVGRALDTYDNFMAKHVAGNMALPGGRYLAEKGIDQIFNLVGGTKSKPTADVIINEDLNEYAKNVETYKAMSDGYASAYGINPMDDPYTFDKISKINKRYRTRTMPTDIAEIKKKHEYVSYKDFIEENGEKFFYVNNSPDQPIFDKISELYAKISMDGKNSVLDTDIPDDVKQYLDNMAKTISEQNPNNPIKFVSEKDFETLKYIEDYPTLKDMWTAEEPDVSKVSTLRDNYLKKQYNVLKNAATPKEGKPYIRKYTNPTGSEVEVKSFQNIMEDPTLSTEIVDKIDDVMSYKKEYSSFDNDLIQNDTAYVNFKNSYNEMLESRKALDDARSELNELKNLKYKYKDTVGDDEIVSLEKTVSGLEEYYKMNLNEVSKSFETLNYQYPELENITRKYTHEIKPRQTAYEIAFSSADFREKHTKEIVDQISKTTAVLVRKYPDAFKDLNLKNTTEFTNAFSKGIRNSMSEYVMDDKRLMKVLTMDTNLFNKKVKYMDVKPEIIKQYGALRRYASTNSPASIRNYLNRHPELETFVEDLILDSVYVPNLKRIFGEFRNSKKYNNTIHSFIQSLKGTEGKEGLLEVIEKNRDILEKPGNEFGQDLLTWADNVNAIIKNATIEDNSLYAANKYLDLSDFEINDKGLAELREALPGFDVRVRKEFQSNFKNLDVKHKQKPVNVSKDILDAIKPYAKADKKAVTKVTKDVAEMKPDAFAKTITETKPVSTTVLESAKEEIVKNIGFTSDPTLIDSMDLTDVVKQYGNRNERRLYALIDSELNAKYAIKSKIRSGTERIDSVKKSKELIDKVYEKYTPEQVQEYLTLRSSMDDQIIAGNEMVNYVIGSKGHVEMSGLSKKEAAALFNTIKNNVDKVNKRGNILEAYNVKSDSGYVVGYRLNYKNPNIKKDVGRYFSMFRKQEALEDMVFYKGVTERPKQLDKYADLEEAFNAMQTASEELSTKLGFTQFNNNYFKFVMKEDEAVQKQFSAMAELTGNNLDKLDKVTDALLNFNTRGSFGTVKYNKAYLGPFNKYPGMFSTDLKEIHSSTFTKGMLDNTNSQTFFDLFLSDNFTIKNNFKDVEHLKNALYVKDGDKSYGNLTNLALVAPKYDKNGKLVGFKQYNKFSDIDLKNAFEDETAVLMPNQLISPLDRMLKKDVRMSNKLYQFINKYVTVPFKFGTLSNPGFLVGNMTDAYFKQAVEMSKKYGTNLEDELAEVAMSMNELVVLNNRFDSIFDEYRQFLRSDGAKNNPIFRKSIAYGKLLSPAIVMNNPEFLKAWTQYLNIMKDGSDRKVAKLYTFINNRQNTALFENNNLDLEDVIDKINRNEYDVPNNIIERVMYGDPTKKGFSSYGLFLNNPISNKILKASNQIEVQMRGAAILNDLKHQGLSTDAISEILEMPKDVASKTRVDLRIKMHDAINTMHASNFDYDQVSPLMDKMSYVMPFPTFYLKNIAYWMDVLVENPEMIDDIISVHEGMWTAKNEDTKTDEFAAEAKGRGAVPVHTGNKHFAGFVKQTPYTSMFGAFNAINDPRNDMAFRINPIARPVTRHLQDDEDVRYRPYSTNMYEKNITAEDPKFNDLAYMFHQLNPYERFTQNALRFPQKMDRGELKLSDFASSIVQPDF